MIQRLIDSGVNGLRLNFSHGSNDERTQQIQWIREASKKAGKPVAILQDLQGPKIRLGMLNENIEVQKGDEIIIISYCKMDFEEAKKFKPVILFPENNFLSR